ncbi:rab11 family-interacting protein 5 [Neosynchiropus ocellatus]
MSSLNEDQKWVPTHVQVTVLRGRGLRGKGKHGTSDVYTIIQLGKEKYSTCVVEKTTDPEWREECSFELQPGVLESSGRSGAPAGGCDLILTVMHRAVIGLDVFLGQAVIQLEKIFHETRCVKNEWYRLNSKTGKKEKERGDIQVTVQFTRNNLTASMYDLVMKDKSGSTFGKLKERIKGKKRSNEEDSSSAILPGGYGSLYRMRQRLPSDGGGEEDYEDDEGGEARRSKMRTFFLRGKLRKSSDTRSSTSLGSESSESSSRGGSLSPTAGISVVVSDLSNSPSNSSNLTADNSPEHIGDPSSLHCEFGDDTSEITIAVPELPPCFNGSHVDSVQRVDPGSGVRQGSLGLGLLQKSLPISTSLQNLSPRSLTDLPKGAAGDGRRWSFDKPGDEEKAAIAAALERREEDASARQIPLLRIPSYSSVKEAESQQKEQSNPTEVKHRGWFGSKDSKPSPHPVKPLTSATLGDEKRGEGRSVLGKLKSTISPGKNSHLSEQETERRKSLTGGAGSYYHLTHSELVALLVQREAELEKQKKEFQQQKTLLAKREVELKRLKPQVRDLEDYIDTLLVRIMEQKPTLLQVRTKLK